MPDDRPTPSADAAADAGAPDPGSLPIVPGLGEFPPWPGDEVDLPSGALFVRRTPPTAPDAEPAVYVHGLGGAATNWTDLAGLLAHRLDARAPDLPGFGHSDPPRDGDWSIPSRVRSVTELIEAGPAPVHLLGNSLGGLVSLVLAATRPDLVRTLTLISPAVPGPVLPARTDPTLPLLLLPGLDRIAERRLARLSPEQRAQRVIELCFADPSRVPPARLAEATAEIVRRESLPWARSALTRSLRGLAAYYLKVGSAAPWRLAARLTMPTLVVWGTEDKLVHASLAPRLARTIRGARLLVLPGVGHTAQLEAPQRTAQAVLALLDGR